ncbi:DUF805 domain-containing protein [Lactococcus hircilactis]|uniref:DUF805 domain-containing protein n=1 Tax=Lactococcus hircilactis TaxID=1494462 RepID=UPI003FA29AA9
MFDSYRKFWLGFSNFTSRTSRSAFWQAIVVHLFIIFVFLIFICGFQWLSSPVLPDGFTVVAFVLAYFLLTYLLISFFAGLSLLTRRLNDVGLPFPLIFLLLLPGIGGIVLTVFASLKSATKAVETLPNFDGEVGEPKILENGSLHFSQAIKNYVFGMFDFRGKTTRRSFLWSQLVFLGIGVFCLFLSVLTEKIESFLFDFTGPLAQLTLLMTGIYFLFILLPELAVFSRRFRDAGISSFKILFLFLGFLTVIFIERAIFRVNRLSYGIHHFELIHYVLFLVLLVLVPTSLAMLLKETKK